MHTSYHVSTNCNHTCIARPFGIFMYFFFYRFHPHRFKGISYIYLYIYIYTHVHIRQSQEGTPPRVALYSKCSLFLQIFTFQHWQHKSGCSSLICILCELAHAIICSHIWPDSPRRAQYLLLSLRWYAHLARLNEKSIQYLLLSFKVVPTFGPTHREHTVFAIIFKVVPTFQLIPASYTGQSNPT